ncbi:MAG: hypothetical protein RL341_1976, partial [Pseudomonadota bacterium]
MKLLNLQLRFLIPLVITLAAAAYVALPLMDQLNLRWFARDLNMRGALLTNTLAESINEGLTDSRQARLQALFDRAVQDERLFAIGLCSPDGKLLRYTITFPRAQTCAFFKKIAQLPDPRLKLVGGPVHVGVHPVTTDEGTIAEIVMLQDLSFIDRRSQDTRQYLLIFIVALGLTIAIITMIVAQLSWRGWVAGVRGILRGEGLLRPLLSPPEMTPIAAELRTRLRDLEDEFRRAI